MAPYPLWIVWIHYSLTSWANCYGHFQIRFPRFSYPSNLRKDSNGLINSQKNASFVVCIQRKVKGNKLRHPSTANSISYNTTIVKSKGIQQLIKFVHLSSFSRKTLTLKLASAHLKLWMYPGKDQQYHHLREQEN